MMNVTINGNLITINPFIATNSPREKKNRLQFVFEMGTKTHYTHSGDINISLHASTLCRHDKPFLRHRPAYSTVYLIFTALGLL
jgi:hypothetical protein